MAYDYYTVCALSTELDAALAGQLIAAANTRGTVLYVECAARGLLAECRREGTLRLLEGRQRQSEGGHGEGPERYLRGARILGAVAGDRDRVVRLVLERVNSRGETSRGTLLFEMLNNHLTAALLSERTGQVLGVWGGEKRLRPGQPYSAPTGGRRFLPGADSLDEFIDAAMAQEDLQLEGVCRRLLVGSDRQQLAELFYRATIDPNTVADTASLHALWEVATGFFEEARTAEGYAYTAGNRWHFSALAPRRLDGNGQVQRGAISAVSAHAVQSNRRQEQEVQHRERIGQALRRAQKNGRRKLAALQADLDEASDGAELERWGHILLAQLASVPAGAERVELVDVFDPSGEGRCLIELNPSVSAAQNAADLLKRAQKYQRRLQLIPERIRQQVAGLSELDSQRELFEREKVEPQETESWLAEKGYLMERGKGAGQAKRLSSGGALAHPRQYITSDGWRVMAGRNNKENDVLTHRMAAQNDFWFHAHGYPGSHVVLQRDGRKEEPSKQALEEAAAVAAFWSKGKSAKKVPVVYTLAKYVSKPRGGAPGQAIMKREKTIVVEPKLLPQADNSHN